MPTKTYVFDLDGTIIHSMPVIEQMYQEFFSARNIRMTKELLKTLLPLGYQRTGVYVKERFHLQETPEEITGLMLSAMLEAYTNRIPAKGAADETLRALRKTGVKMAVLTASPREFLDPCLKRLGWRELFDYALTVEEFGKTKEDSSLFTDVAEFLHESSKDCCIVDDNMYSLRSGKKAGWRAVGIYDEISNGEYVDEMKASADIFIYDIKELLQ